jgi:hypothetical protein
VSLGLSEQEKALARDLIARKRLLREDELLAELRAMGRLRDELRATPRTTVAELLAELAGYPRCAGEDCEQPFEPTKHGKRYCSEKCRGRAARHRHERRMRVAA